MKINPTPLPLTPTQYPHTPSLSFCPLLLSVSPSSRAVQSPLRPTGPSKAKLMRTHSQTERRPSGSSATAETDRTFSISGVSSEFFLPGCSRRMMASDATLAAWIASALRPVTSVSPITTVVATSATYPSTCAPRSLR